MSLWKRDHNCEASGSVFFFLFPFARLEASKSEIENIYYSLEVSGGKWQIYKFGIPLEITLLSRPFTVLREFLAILNELKLEETIQRINTYYMVYVVFIYFEKNIKKILIVSQILALLFLLVGQGGVNNTPY